MNPSTKAEQTCRQARTLTEALSVFDPLPLRGDCYDAFYCGSINEQRGSHAAKHLQVTLTNRTRNSPCKAFLVGTSGSGKSTEMETLKRAIGSSYESLVVSARESLNITSFEPFDFLFLIATQIAENTHRLCDGETSSPELLRQLSYFGAEASEIESNRRRGELSFDVGYRVGTPNLLDLFKFFADVRSSLRFAHSKETIRKLYTPTRMSELSRLVSQILDECGQILREKTGRDWLVIGEDFDKADVDSKSLRSLFVSYGQVLLELPVNMVLNIPRYILSEAQAPQFQTFYLNDIAVFSTDHHVVEEPIEALKRAVEKRANLGLFEEGALRAAIVSSGGLFSTLFSILLASVINALVDDQERVERKHMKEAISKVRMQFRSKLSPSPYDILPATPDEKISCLKTVYERGARGYFPDALAHRLIDLQLILTHNGTGWYSLHPLAVDTLAARNEPISGGGSLPEYR